ncbi:MAG TPA: lysylphosphatidylglycerol synthase domain-containing protein [Gaiellaceae bacterium]|nr:lysylphosphatidylglycerol synthase domain-containing protein [Gaiellaceae bacterium]
MNAPRPAARLSLRPALLWAGAVAVAASVVFVALALDPGQLAATARAVAADPLAALVALGLYGLAFVLRAAVWTRVLPALSFGQALAAIHVSLAGNHVLPLRLGEALRVTSVVRRARVPVAEATASTIFLRAADILAVAALAAALSPAFAGRLLGSWGLLLLGLALTAWAAGVVWLGRLAARRRLEIRLSIPLVAIGAVTAWLLESAVVWQAARYAGIELTVLEAILVTSVTIAAQVFAVTPGGVGTYEAAGTAALVALGADPGAALAAALAAHALKTGYSLVTGAVAVVRPAPGLFGRVRLPRGLPQATPAAADDGHVVLFLPAHDEEASVADVVRRVPARVLGRPVRCLVVDDGSTDGTAAEAALAGAEVLSFERNRGLGAAVRAGLAHAVAGGASAVAFCDADGEYAPEELERLLAPILRGEADYVAGSRFAGGTRKMRPHRLLGNVVLTRLLSFVARRRIGDGQTGYRAFSARAAAHAEVIHDFNYAQVLTLDLLGKGYRYTEVPISYRFRTEGQSFVRLGRYLRTVVPAVHRELNATA